MTSVRASLHAFVGVVVVALACASSSLHAAGPLGLRMQTNANAVQTGETFQLDVVLTVRGQDQVDEFNLPDLSQFDVVQSSDSSSASMYLTNGRREVVVEMRKSFLLRATHPGELHIGEASARLGNAKTRADGLAIRVTGKALDDDGTGSANAGAHDNGASEPGDDDNPGPAPGARFGAKLPSTFLEVRVEPTDAWVGQQITATTEVWTQTPLSQWPRIAGIKPPGFVCASIDDGTRPQASQRTIKGRTYYVYPAARDALFAMQAGDVTIPPMHLDVAPAGSWFSGARDVRIESAPTTLHIKPLPAGAPIGFVDGNVGTWSVAVTATPTSTTVGQPITLRMTATGHGQLDALQMPALPALPDARAYPATQTRTRADRDGVVAGTIVVEQLVQPTRAGVLRIPPLVLVTFDPQSGAFREVTSSALAVDVRDGSGAADRNGGASGRIALPRESQRIDVGARPIRRGLRDDDIDARPRFDALPLAGAIVAFIGACVAGAGRWRRRRAGTDGAQRAARVHARRHDAQAAAARSDLAAVQRVVVDALVDRVGDEVRGCAFAQLGTLLTQHGVHAPLAQRVSDALADAEAARYAPGGGARNAILDELCAVLDAVDADTTDRIPEPAPRAHAGGPR